MTPAEAFAAGRPAVICMLNSKYIHSSLAPWYLLAGVDRWCAGQVTAEVVEGTINGDIDAMAERLSGLNPAAIGFCCYIWNISAVEKLLPMVKKALPDTVIILGGPEVGYRPAEILVALPEADYVLSGEGEEPFSRLLSVLVSGGTPEGLPGVSFRRAGEPVTALPHWTPADPPSPYSEAYFKTLSRRIAYIESSRGCPYACAFCLSGRTGSVRWFDRDRVKRELLQLAASGTQTIKFVDRTFNADRARARELFRFILEQYGTAIPAGVRFHFEIAGDLLDEETLSLLSDAPKGALQFEIGLQSFNEKTLEAVNRKTDVSRLVENIERLRAPGNIHMHIDLIAGLPFEDMGSFAAGFNTAYRLRPHMLQLGFLKLLHGAPMREEPARYPCLYKPTPPYEVTETPWLSKGELLALHDLEAAFDRLYNSGRFRRTLEYVLERTDLTPFDLFSAAGRQLADHGAKPQSLDDFTEAAAGFFASLGGVEREVLRDKMACDRLGTNPDGRLPAGLQVPDPLLKKAADALRLSGEWHGSGRRGCALLYTENALVWADYTERDPITGEYVLHKKILGWDILAERR